MINITTATPAGVQAQGDFGLAVARTTGATIKSFANSGTGVVTLYTDLTGEGTTEGFAVTSADMLAIATALTGDAKTVSEALIFKVDADGNGTADGSFIVAEHAGGLEMVYLVGVAAVSLNAVPTAANITIA